MVLSPYKHEPLNQFGEDLTPEQEQSTRDYWARVHAGRTPEQNVASQNRLKQEREARFGTDNTPEQQQKVGDYWKQAQRQPGDSQKSAALGLKQTKKLTEDELEDLNAKTNKESRLARALRARQQAKRKAKADMLGKAGISGVGKGTLQKVRQIKNIIRVIRGGTLAGTSLGDVFFCLSGLFLSLVGEWLIAKFQIVPGYKMFDPEDRFVLLDKLLWYGGWAVIAAVLALVVVLAYFVVYLKENPLEAIKSGIGL